jgi:nucleotide-binding universal stress UspA family protein
MQKYKVLIPLDGSRSGEHALVYLNGLKGLGDLEVQLLSIAAASEPTGSLSAAESLERETNLLSTYLREVAHDVHTHLGIEVETKVTDGVPAYCIINLARAFAPDLMIVSTHGRTGAKRWRMGSVADKVIRGAECNTLIIGPKATAKETWIDQGLVAPFTSILVPLDGSELAKQAIPIAGRLAESFGSTLNLVRVVQVPAQVTGFAMEGTYTPGLIESMVDGATEDLMRTAEQCSETVAVKLEVKIGDTAIELEEYVRDHAVDLIVMTSHGRGGLVRTALGSVTDRLLSSAVAPVLVVRPPHSA